MIPEILFGDSRSTCRTKTRTERHRLEEQAEQRGPRRQHLKPLGAVAGGGGPGVRLAPFVQASEVRVPGERLQPPRTERGGSGDLAV